MEIPWEAAMADMVATSTEAEEETPLPSGTVEETCTLWEVYVSTLWAIPQQTICKQLHIWIEQQRIENRTGKTL